MWRPVRVIVEQTVCCSYPLAHHIRNVAGVCHSDRVSVHAVAHTRLFVRCGAVLAFAVVPSNKHTPQSRQQDYHREASSALRSSALSHMYAKARFRSGSDVRSGSEIVQHATCNSGRSCRASSLQLAFVGTQGLVAQHKKYIAAEAHSRREGSTVAVHGGAQDRALSSSKARRL